MQRFLRWFALIASLTAVGLLLVIPSYSYRVERASTGGSAVERVGTGTLIDANGFGVLLVLAIPVLTAVNAVLPWPATYRRGADILSAVVATAFSILGAMTVGMYFLPTSAALIGLAFWPRTRRPAA